ITAVYSGDPNFNASTSPGITQTVNRHPTVTTFVSATPNASSAGAPVTFTFVVSPTIGALPSGTLTVRDGATILGTTTPLLDLSGGATATFTTTRLGSGQHSITASYGGDQNYLGRASSPLIETVLTTKDFSFAVSSVDAQVYMHQLDLNGGPSIGWSLVAPGQFLSVAAGTYGPLRARVVFGVG